MRCVLNEVKYESSLATAVRAIVRRRASVTRRVESSSAERKLRLSTTTMLVLALFAILSSSLLPIAVRGSALTTAIAANERLCFYADVDKAGEKIGVRLLHVTASAPTDIPNSSTSQCSPVALSKSTSRSRTRMTRTSSMDSRNARETTF